MIILDENILDGQRLLLEASRVATRQIGVDVGRKGMKGFFFDSFGKLFRNARSSANRNRTQSVQQAA